MKTISIMNFGSLTKYIKEFEKEFLKEGEYIDSINFKDDFTFKDKLSRTWGTDTLSRINIRVSNEKFYGNIEYKNIGDIIPEWKKSFESISYRD